MKFRAHLLAVIGLASLPSSAQPHMDFRQTTWGMTKAQVLAAESHPPSEVRENNGETIVQYDSIKLAGLDGAILDTKVVYIFAKDKLVRAKYLLDAEHDDLNDCIADYHAVEPLLRSTYGEPTWQRAVWEDDSLQEERKSYLDQDRALPENILPSDRLVGLSVSLGHLKLYTEWGEGPATSGEVRTTSVRTRVLHALTGADGHITHQIEYRSVELGALEDEVRGQGSK
jgi:hypothetical protein